jgi:hypothetical protein
LPPSRAQFAWAIAQRTSDKNYFHTKLVEWEPVSGAKPPVEADTAAAPAAGSPNAANTPATVTPATGTPPVSAPPNAAGGQGRIPSNLVFRTKVVTRKPK